MKGPHNWHAKLGVLLLHLALLWAVSQFQSPQWIRPGKASIAVTLLSADTHTFAPVAPVATFASAAEQALKAPTTTQAVTPNQPKPAKNQDSDLHSDCDPELILCCTMVLQHPPHFHA